MQEEVKPEALFRSLDPLEKKVDKSDGNRTCPLYQSLFVKGHRVKT
jgi:hypothetical protein